MRKWQNYAAPDDPNSYFDVDGLWPTNRGTYEASDFHTPTDYTAAGGGNVSYAFAAGSINQNLRNPEYIVDTSHIWQYTPDIVGTPLTDRTGAVTIGPRQKMAMFGDVCICVMGSPRGVVAGAATVYATTNNNFAALAGAPQGDCIAVASNAVAIANTDTAADQIKFSDVGDHTNWTTGEATSLRLYDTPGPILALTPFRGLLFAFKYNSIHRLQYVGGDVKWSQEAVWRGASAGATNRACAGATGILFAGYSRTDSGSPTVPYYWYDGVNPPVLTNPLTEVGSGPIIYNPHRDLFTIWSGSSAYYFAPKDMSWGRASAPLGASFGVPLAPVESDGLYGIRELSPTNAVWLNSATNTQRRYSGANGTGTSYVETTKLGRADMKTFARRATPRLRRKASLGTTSSTMFVSMFRELHDTTAQTTLSVAESSTRHRYDFTLTDNFVRAKLSYTAWDVEIEDLAIEGITAGTN